MKRRSWFGVLFSGAAASAKAEERVFKNGHCPVCGTKAAPYVRVGYVIIEGVKHTIKNPDGTCWMPGDRQGARCENCGAIFSQLAANIAEKK